MTIHITEYTNPAGTAFSIDVVHLEVPANADYWGYSFLVQELQTGLRNRYRGLVLKSVAATQGAADNFILGDPLDFVRHAFLGHYANGETPSYWPNLELGWVVY